MNNINNMVKFVDSFQNIIDNMLAMAKRIQDKNYLDNDMRENETITLAELVHLSVIDDSHAYLNKIMEDNIDCELSQKAPADILEKI